MILNDAIVYRVGDLYLEAHLNFGRETNGVESSVLFYPVQCIRFGPEHVLLYWMLEVEALELLLVFRC